MSLSQQPDRRLIQGENQRKKFSQYLRQFFIGLLSLSLVYGVGFTIGKNQGAGPVDQAIKEIVAVDPKGASLEILRQAAIEGALRATGDEWSNYFPESTMDVFNERLFNEYTGLGIWLRKKETGSIEVAGIQGSSPAQSSGIKLGDLLLSVNENSLEGLSLSSSLAIIRGAIGKSVDLRIDRSGREFVLSLERATLSIENVTVSKIARGVVLIDIANFNLGTSLQISNQLKNLDTVNGIVIDLRDNPGGQIIEAVKTAELFVSSGVLVSYQKVDNEPIIFRSQNSNPNSSPLVILINRESASAAEIFAGALQDRNRAVLIGERTQGKGTVQEFITLNDGSKLELTVAKYRTPSGRIIDGIGIEPDLAAKDDEIARRALQVLSGLASLNPKKS